MKKILLSAAFSSICALFELSAQSLSPTVIASSGAHRTGGSIQLSYTIGELTVETKTAPNTVLTQGFHQTFPNATGINWLSEKEKIKVYPNPAIDVVHIEVEANHDKWMQTKILDVSGKVVAGEQSFNNQKHSLDVSTLCSGLYFLQIINDDGMVKAIYKIEKI
jgi:hypothetical protein